MATKEKNVEDIIKAITKVKTKIEEEDPDPKTQIEGLRDVLKLELKNENLGSIWAKPIFKETGKKIRKLQKFFENCQDTIDKVTPKAELLAQSLATGLDDLSKKFGCIVSSMNVLGAFCEKIANTKYGTKEHREFMESRDYIKCVGYYQLLQNCIDFHLPDETAFTKLINEANGLLNK